VQEFYSKYLLGHPQVAEQVKTSLGYAEKRNVCKIIDEPNEFAITGTVKNRDIADRLPEIGVLTLITV